MKVEWGICQNCGKESYLYRGSIYCVRCNGEIGKRWDRTKKAISKNIVFDKCSICGSTENLTLDHIIPKSKGGSDDSDNLRILCNRCNSSKGVS